MKNPKYVILLGALLIAVVTAAAGLLLFSQTLPAVSTGAALSANCSTLTSTILSGTVEFQCASQTAFNATSTHIFKPTFSLPSQYASLSVSTSSSCTSPIVLTSGGNVTLAASGYDYCAAYSTAPATFPAFTVTWTQ